MMELKAIETLTQLEIAIEKPSKTEQDYSLILQYIIKNELSMSTSYTKQDLSLLMLCCVNKCSVSFLL